MSDLIDRSALGIGYADPNRFDDPKYADGWNSAISIINAAPTVDAEPVRHGRWIKYEHGSGIYCSECRHKRRYRDMNDNYCPNCGAKMDRGGD